MQIVRAFKHAKGLRVHIPRNLAALLDIQVGDHVALDAQDARTLILRNATKELRQTKGDTDK